MKKNYLSIFIFLFSLSVSAQTEYVYQTFYDTRIVNGQSVETNYKGVMKMVISHRFGSISDGIQDFFGLDNATMRTGFDYGLTDGFTVGIGRSSFEKTYDGFAKWRLMKQCKGDKNHPFSLVLFTGMAIKTNDWPIPERENYFSSRLYYTFQILAARKFSDRFSLQIMPSLVHRNLVATTAERNDVLAFGTAAKYKLTKNITLNAEYYYTAANALADRYKNSLAIGIDIDTKGHVFQLHFGNSKGMTEKFFITETTGDWFDADIYFGFNISRDFKMTGRKYKSHKE